MKSITVQQLSERSDVPLIDVREADEFAAGRVPGAINIPMSTIGARLDELPDGPFRAYTPRTITDREALAVEIDLVRMRGYAQAIGEREPGLTAVAAPIRSARGELEAVVALQGPSERFDEAAVADALPLLLERAETISRELGWRPL